MKKVFLASAIFWIATAPAAITGEPTQKSLPLKCDIGPVAKTYGKTPWLVYSCNDRRTILIVSAPGNPAMPFYFTVSPGQDGYHVNGEGSGSKAATAAAFQEIKKFTKRDITALIEETKFH